MNKDKLRRLFLKWLTQDSSHDDARRKNFNQAIFDEKGWACFNGTTLSMVMDKFERAMKEYDEEGEAWTQKKY